jgi:hypothetical protein
MTRVNKTINAGLATLATLAAPAVALANNSVNLGLPTGSAFASTVTWNASRLAAAAINLILVAAGLIAFFFFLYGGLQWILAGGDKEATEKARKRITSSLIGLVIIFSTYAFIALVSSFLGVNLTNFSISNV